MEVKEILRQSYNKFAVEREKNKQQQWKIKVRESFLQLLNDEKKTTILDIGAGTGRDSKYFADNNLEVMAVDLSDEMVRLCEEKGVKAKQLDFYNLKEIGEKFDAVWSMNSLLHVEKKNLNLVLENIKRVLKPSGLFYMGVYGGEDSEGIWENDIYTPHRFFSFFTDESIIKVVSEHFEIISFEAIDVDGKFHFQSIIMRNK